MLKLSKYELSSNAPDQLRGAFLQLHRRGQDRAADWPATVLRRGRPFDHDHRLRDPLITLSAPRTCRWPRSWLSSACSRSWSRRLGGDRHPHQRAVRSLMSSATGFGIGFSLSVIIPSFYAFYMNWLGAVMPFELTPVFLLALGAIIGTIAPPRAPRRRTWTFTEASARPSSFAPVLTMP